MFGQSLLSAFGIACTTDTDQLFDPTSTQINSLATYQLNNATTSIPSNTYPGTASNITYTAGKFGDAAVFNGSSSYISLPSGINKNNDFSWSCWVNFNSLADYDTVIALQDTYRNYLDILANGTLEFFDGNLLTTPSGTITTSTWYNVVITKSSSTGRKIYVNGSEVASDTTTTSSTSGSGQDMIGAYNSGSSTGAYLDGKIDQVRIFNTALSQAAITALYNETTTTATYAYITVEEYNSVAYYKMENATDQLGNYNGTATDVNFNTEGKFGFAGAFDGSSSYIDTDTTFTPDSMSFSVWVYPTDSSVVRTIFSNRDGNSTNYKGIDFGITASGNIYNRFDNGGSRGDSNSNTVSLPLNTWTHLAFTVDMSNSIQKVYKNGTFEYQETTSGSIATGNDFYIGRYFNSSSSYWQGKIDQIRIFNQALTATEVSTLAEEVYCQPTPIVATNFHNTALYTGNATSNSVSIGFNADLTWIKNRGASAYHILFDTVRGLNEVIHSDNTGVQQGSSMTNSYSNGTLSFSGSTTWGNKLNNTYVAWGWKGGGTAVTNNDGSIASQVSANPNGGFSIVKYTGNGSSSATVGHGLGILPELTIFKQLGSGGTSGGYWNVYYTPNNTVGFLNESNAFSANSGGTNGSVDIANMDSTKFGFLNGSSSVNNQNNNGLEFIVYCFASIPGYSRVGSYIGQTAGITIYTGFQPRFIMVKSTSNVENWAILDAARGSGKCLNPNLANAESDSTLNTFTTTATGFSFPHQNTADAMLNENGYEYIFLAIA